MAIGDVLALVNESGTVVFSVDQSGNVTILGTISSTGLLDILGEANAWTNTNDYSKTVTAADELINVDLSVNHATAVGVAIDAHAIQATTARTGGAVYGNRSKTTSLAGDLNSVKYFDYYAEAPTDGGGTVIHVAYGVGASHDRLIDASAALTAQNLVVLPSNVADAWSYGNGTIVYWTVTTTTATPGIAESWSRTAAGTGHSTTTSLNHATASGQGSFSHGVQLTTARTSGLLAGHAADQSAVSSRRRAPLVGKLVVLRFALTMLPPTAPGWANEPQPTIAAVPPGAARPTRRNSPMNMWALEVSTAEEVISSVPVRVVAPSRRRAVSVVPPLSAVTRAAKRTRTIVPALMVLAGME